MQKPKKIGIIGGMGSRAGAEFLSKLIAYSPALNDQQFPEIILHNNSAIPDRTRAIVLGEESPVPEMLRSVELLEQNRVDLMVLACITSYHFYKDVITRTAAKVVNPIQLLSDVINTQYPNIKKIGVLATTGTMKSGLFETYFQSDRFELIRLNQKDQEDLFMRSVYMDNGLKSSNVSAVAKELMLTSAHKLVDKGAEIIVGGCSEVQLAVSQENVCVPFIDLIDLMAKNVIEESYGIRLRVEETLIEEIN